MHDETHSAGKRPGGGSVVQALALVALGGAVLALSAGIARALRGRLDRPSVGTAAGGAINSPARGRLLYQVHCARCHGPEGHGDGADAGTLRPPPRDFAVTAWRFAPDLATIRQVVRAGIPGTAMTAWGGALSAGELDAVAAHVRTLAPRGEGSGTAISSDRESVFKNAEFRPRLPPEPAPALTVHDLDGGRHTLDEWRGGLILVVFWGTSCAPCLEELPDLERLADEFRGKGLIVLAVCADETDPAIVRRVVRGRVERLSVYVTRDATARLRYDAQVLPSAFLIDREGRLLGSAEGGQQWTGPAMRRLLAECLAEPADG